MIKGYNEFINEESVFGNTNNDIDKFLTNLIQNNVPTDEILDFRGDLDDILSVNESFKDDLNKLKYKYGSWLNDRLFKWLINRKKNFYNDLKDKLSVFDLTTLDDVFHEFPGFKIKSLYLAGGMDEAPGTGRGWRDVLEREFEINTETSNDRVSVANVAGKDINPSHVVDGEYLDDFLENPKKTYNLYEKPLLLNPVRKEIDRTKDDTFDVMVDKLKKPGYNPKEEPESFDWFRDTFSKNIEPDDEDLLRISDAVFLGQDNYAGAGTYGELELLSLMRKPLFVWLVNASTDNVGGIKLWTIPHVSKVARNQEEMKVLVKTILDYS